MKPLPRAYLAGGLILASGIAGYLLASPDSVGLKDAFTPRWKSTERGATDTRPRRIEDPVRDLSRLLRDDMPRTEIWAIVSRIPMSQMPEAIRLLKEAAEKDGYDQTLWNEIASALYFHWAESDPQAAMADALTFPKEGRALSSAVTGVLSAWMRVDADAAYRHVMLDEKAGYLARDMYVRTWTTENAFANADRYPEKRGDLLGWYAINHINDPARRDAMLAGLAEKKDLKERGWVYQLLFRAWGYNDFNEAMTASGRQGIPWLEKQLLTDNLEGFNSYKVLQWASANGRTPTGPVWEKGYSNWLMIGPEQAREWLAAEAPKWKQAGRNDMVAGFLAKDVEYSIQSGQTTGSSLQTLTNHLAAWQASDPKAAEEWLRIAPDAVRKSIAESRKGGAQ
jgi:hypothetical protein